MVVKLFCKSGAVDTRFPRICIAKFAFFFTLKTKTISRTDFEATALKPQIRPTIVIRSLLQEEIGCRTLC